METSNQATATQTINVVKLIQNQQLNAVMRNALKYVLQAIFITAVTGSIMLIPAINSFVGDGVIAVAILAMLIMIFTVRKFAFKMHTTASKIFFYLYSVLFGIAIGKFVGQDVTSILIFSFLGLAVTLAVMAIYLLNKKNDLSKFKPFLIAFLIGLVMISILNVFTTESFSEWVPSLIAVFLLPGLAIYTQYQFSEALEDDKTFDRNKMDKIHIGAAILIYMGVIPFFMWLWKEASGN